MVYLKVTFILCLYVFQAYTSNINESEQYAPHISAILNNLNSNPNKIYDYQKGTFVNSQQKANIIELTVDVEVICTVNYPEVPCTKQVLTCNGFLQYSEGAYKVLSQVLCNPKQDYSIETSDEHTSVPTSPPAESKIELSHEAVSSDQSADFVAVKADTVPCVGCPFDLNTDVEGVSSLIDTALKHIETERIQKHVAIRVIRLQQQVIAGVKYLLTLEVAPTVCQKDVDMYLTNCPLDSNVANSVCEIIFLQKPWISKEKIIIGNNCTMSQEYPPESKRSQRNDMSNDINSKQLDLTPQHLADLESQILNMESENTKPISKKKVKSNLYPKKVQYQEIVETPSDNQFYTTRGVPNTIQYEPFVESHGRSTNVFSTPFTAYKSTLAGILHTEQPGITSERVNNANHISNSINSQTDNLKQYENAADEERTEPVNKLVNVNEPHLQEPNEKFERLRRELNGPIADTSESSDSQGDNTGERFNSRKRRDLDNTSSDSSESQGDETKEHVRSKRHSSKLRKRDENGDSNSSNSKSSESESKESSESHEDNTTENPKSRKKSPLDHSNSDSSGSQEDEALSKVREKRYLDNSDSKSSDGEDSGESTISKRSANYISSHNDRHKRKSNDNDDSSSSSSSSSSESKSKEKEEDKENNSKNDNSSSSSSESKSNEKQEHKKNKSKNDSSSSSSSSSSSEEESKRKKKHDDSLKDSSGNKSKNDDSDSSNSSSSESKSSENDVNHNSESDVNVNIKFNKVKRSVGQLEKITQEEKFLVRDLADFAAFSLDNIDDDNHKRVILQILSAKKLKLDGIYYHMILRLGISQCSENEDDENCRDKLFPNLTKICKVLVHVEDDLSNPKVVKSQCQNIKKDDRDRNRTNYSRYRRDVLVGALSSISLDDPSILEFTRDALTELDSQSENVNKHEIIKIVSATSQVVAGAKYQIKAIISLSNCLKNDTSAECGIPKNSTIKSCDIEVWDRPWLNQRETTFKCDDSDKEYHFKKTKSRKRRSFSKKILYKDANILGEVEEQTSDNQKAANYLKDILLYLDNESGHSNKLKIEDVISVEKQVVAGELWRIKARITLSDCPQTDAVDSQLCKNLEGSESRTCIFKIWDRPWLPNGREVQTNCENESKPYNFRLKRSLGDSKYVIPSSLNNNNQPNPKILQYLKTGLEYLDTQSDHETKYILKNIKNMSRKTVGGALWHVTAEIKLSDCPKQYNTRFCEELEDAESKTCQFVIWDRSWLSNNMQINITCENDDNAYSFSPKHHQHITTFYTEELLTQFNDFMVKHDKTYLTDTEFSYRLKVFKDNLNTIKLLNKYEKGTARYGITRFADLTAKEFSKSHGLRSDLRNENEPPFSNAVIPDMELPTEFDWRKKGVVTEVKDQGSCGSCWAFSTTGNVEGQYAIKYQKLLEFSEQELVDCDKLDEGCNGGLMDNAYRTIEKIGGLETESDYPYDAEDETCHFNKTKVRVQLSGALNISHNEDDMAKWLVKNGPISIAINANAMQFYMAGVSHPWKALCNPKNLDHGVLIVGYGVHKYPLFNKSLPYWIVKNSWGPSWGEQGYYRVFRGDGTCGLNQTPSSAIVA